MIAEIYVEVDDFCQNRVKKISSIIESTPYFKKLYQKRSLGKGMTMSEIMTILIYYHHSGYKNFKTYYHKEVLKYWKEDFPDLVSYSRFVWWIPIAFLPLLCFVLWECRNGRRTGIYFIDSTKIRACHDKRVHQNKVSKGFASWGKTSVGWFWGFKLHLLVNQYGEMIDFYFTTGSISDNKIRVLFHITQSVQGWVFGDKGYLCNQEKLEFVEHDGKISWFAKPRSNQKTKKSYYDSMPFEARFWAKKRGLIETTIGIQKEELDLEHTRHRSFSNTLTHLIAALAAYYFRVKKPKATVDMSAFLLTN